MTRTSDTTLTNIFSPSILAGRERYAAERAAAPAAPGPAAVRTRSDSRRRVATPPRAQDHSPAAR